MKNKQGFTLIELLVVISIISLLASIVLASLNSVRAKARDTKAIAELRSISIALQLYYDKYNSYPDNQGESEAFCDCGSWLLAYDALMQKLVDEKFLPQIPRGSSNGSCPTSGSSVGIYCYYRYGPGPQGAIIKANLETIPDTTTGISPSCRWNSGVGNWCNNSVNNKEYCLCHPY